MKTMITKLTAFVLSLIMLTGACGTGYAVGEVKSFSDVDKTHWAYDAIMDMAINRGMINGTTSPDANGVGKYEPNASMTRAQFVTIVTRYLYPDELAAFEKAPDDPWFMGNYVVAIQEGLLNKSDFALSEMGQPMTRQEMAMVLVRAMAETGENTDIQVVKDSRIPDYNQIGTKYREFVKIAYTKGLINGTDSAGTFNPKGTLNRAQAATVIYRLLEEGTRKPIDVKEESNNQQEQDNGGDVQPSGYSWVEGQAHDRIPQVGDTVIKADGTKVVLKIGPGGVLGAGQGVDIYTGYTANGRTLKEGMSAISVTGDGTPLVYNAYSGEMHTQTQWNLIEGATYPGNGTKGTHGEIRNYWWQWSDIFMRWAFIGGSGKPIT